MKNDTSEQAAIGETDGDKPKLSRSRTRKVMKTTLAAVKKLGAGATGLLGRLRKDRSPEAMLKTLDDGLGANRKRREEVSSRIEGLFKEISVQKKAYAKAPKARKRILQAELKSKLATYKAAERELNVLLENERVITQVRGRLNEMLAYGMATVTEDLIDDVALDIDDSAADAEGRLDAARELERTGKRREHPADQEDFLEALSEFDEELSEPEELETSPGELGAKKSRPREPQSMSEENIAEITPHSEKPETE